MGPGGWTPSTLDVGRDDYFEAGVDGCLDFSESAFLTGGSRSRPPRPRRSRDERAVTDDLPIDFSPARSRRPGHVRLVSRTVTCDLGTIGPAGEAVVTIAGTPTTAGAIQNSASVEADQVDPGGATTSRS